MGKERREEEQLTTDQGEWSAGEKSPWEGSRKEKVDMDKDAEGGGVWVVLKWNIEKKEEKGRSKKMCMERREGARRCWRRRREGARRCRGMRREE